MSRATAANEGTGELEGTGGTGGGIDALDSESAGDESAGGAIDISLECSTFAPCTVDCASDATAAAYREEFVAAIEASGFSEVVEIGEASMVNGYLWLPFGFRRPGFSAGPFRLTVIDDPNEVTAAIEEQIEILDPRWLDPELELIDGDEFLAIVEPCIAKLKGSECTNAPGYDPCVYNRPAFETAAVWLPECATDICGEPVQNVARVDVRTGALLDCFTYEIDNCDDG